MFSLILSICMITTNADGKAIGAEVCEEAVVAEHRTIGACTRNMDKQIKVINRSLFANFDWMLSCENMSDSGPEEEMIESVEPTRGK
jgi:hypothetical protein